MVAVPLLKLAGQILFVPLVVGLIAVPIYKLLFTYRMRWAIMRTSFMFMSGFGFGLFIVGLFADLGPQDWVHGLNVFGYSTAILFLKPTKAGA